MKHNNSISHSQRFRVRASADAVNSTETAAYERPIIDGSKNVAREIGVTGWYVLRSRVDGEKFVWKYFRSYSTSSDIIDGPFAFRRDAEEAARNG